MALGCDIPLEELHLSLRVYTALKRAKIDTVADLVTLAPTELAQALASRPEWLAQLREGLRLHARRVLDVTERHDEISELPISWLLLGREVQARLKQHGVHTLAALADATISGLTAALGRPNTEALLVRFYAYCAVRGRDDQEPSPAPWLRACMRRGSMYSPRRKMRFFPSGVS